MPQSELDEALQLLKEGAKMVDGLLDQVSMPDESFHPVCEAWVRKVKEMTEPTYDFPWPDVTGIYSDAGPPEMVEFLIEGHQLKVTPTSLIGCDTGRRRYKVECLSCEETIHKATTGPRSLCRYHVEGNL